MDEPEPIVTVPPPPPPAPLPPLTPEELKARAADRWALGRLLVAWLLYVYLAYQVVPQVMEGYKDSNATMPTLSGWFITSSYWLTFGTDWPWVAIPVLLGWTVLLVVKDRWLPDRDRRRRFNTRLGNAIAAWTILGVGLMIAKIAWFDWFLYHHRWGR